MGDEKDHMTIQKKETETASQEVVSQDFDTATESLDPPSLQLKVDEKSESKEEGGDLEKEGEGAFQFATAAPPEQPQDSGSRTFGSDTIQGKGIAEPFKMPTIQKKAVDPQSDRNTDRPSFTV